MFIVIYAVTLRELKDLAFFNITIIKCITMKLFDLT